MARVYVFNLENPINAFILATIAHGPMHRWIMIWTLLDFAAAFTTSEGECTTHACSPSGLSLAGIHTIDKASSAPFTPECELTAKSYIGAWQFRITKRELLVAGGS